MSQGQQSAATRRVFLGWDRPALPAAAEWLLEAHGADLSGVVVALPGGRAARGLRQHLAQRAAPGWQPPMVVTQGRLVDELLTLSHPAAPRLARTLAWARALESLDQADLQRLSSAAASRRDSDSLLRLAETVRTLHARLAPEGLEFCDLERETADLEAQGESERWAVLARAQAAWRELLAGCGLADPHEGRRAALEAGQIDTSREVVLVGVADMNRLLAGVIEQLGDRATTLITAPEEHAAGFDAGGRLVAEYWTAQEVPLGEGDESRWFVEDKPSDQADRAADLIAGWAQDRAAEQITVGIADEEVAPYLERRLAPARLRLAAGTPLPRTRPFRLLRAVCDLVERGGTPEVAALARHCDLDGKLGDADPARVLDRYHARHLPRELGSPRPDRARDESELCALEEGLAQVLGELSGDGARPLGEWAAATRDLLRRVYDDAGDGGKLDPWDEHQRVLAAALRAVGAALEEFERVPVELAGSPVKAHEALDLLLRGLRSVAVPPAPARAGEPTLEALGWLELTLDDAPALVVTGFNDGRVPQSVQGDAFLPDGLIRRLGLPDNEARLARDVFATRVLLAQRADCALITGRRQRSGDPLIPSRIAFQVPAGDPEDILTRVRRFLGDEVHPSTTEQREDDPPYALPRAATLPALQRISVTSFKRYLESPYLFYLQNMLRLATCDDRARELNPMEFGNFAHAVLEDFGQSEVADSLHADEIEGFLLEAAEARALRRFGAEPLPAVTLQLEQLKFRLRRAAEVQARRRADGWKIRASEWKPEGGVPFDVDGEPVTLSGKIDRIDVHEDGRWAILDYKTGDRSQTPDEAARKGGKKTRRWVDLQLPLYGLLAVPLAESLGLEGDPELGYFHLGRSSEGTAVMLAEEWSRDDLDEAIELARDVVRRIRAGEFFDLGGTLPYKDDHVFLALVGAGLLHVTAPQEEAAPA